MLLVLQLSVDGHYDLANVDPDQCAPGLSKGTTHTCLELRLGIACQSSKSTGKSCIQGPLGQPVQATGCIHYRGGCCLQPLHTGPPRGKEHSRLNWLQKFFFFQVRKLYTMLYVNYTTIKLGVGRGMRKLF